MSTEAKVSFVLRDPMALLGVVPKEDVVRLVAVVTEVVVGSLELAGVVASTELAGIVVSPELGVKVDSSFPKGGAEFKSGM